MLWLYGIILGFWSMVQTSPISNDLDFLDINPDSSFDVHPNPDTANDLLISNDSHDSLHSDCSTATSTSALAENDLLSPEDFNLLRRNPTICRPRLTDPKSQNEEPKHPFTLVEPSSDPCPDESREGIKTPLTCAGPEHWEMTWDTRFLMLVVNCELGELFSFDTLFVQKYLFKITT